jgi:hypothetical protein
MHHLLDEACLNLVIECLQGKVGSRAHDVESGVEIVGAVGENECAGVNEPEGEVKGSRSEWRGGERKGERFGERFRIGRPGDEGGVEIWRMRYEDESVGGEYGSGIFMGCGEVSCEGDAYV